MKMSEKSFWNSSLAKIFSLIDIHLAVNGQNEESADITSMKQIEGW